MRSGDSAEQKTPVQTAQTARAVPCIIPAGTQSGAAVSPGEYPIMVSGDRFYVLAASSGFSIQPVSGSATGAANPYGVGQGARLKNRFETLSLKNFNLFSVTALIWVGFDDFVNDQLVLASSSYQQVAFPTFPVAGANGPMQFNDLSGAAFLDINGKRWLALSRANLIVCNPDQTADLFLQKNGATTTPGPSVGIVLARTSFNLPLQGAYTITNGVGIAINATGSEIYNAIPG